MSKLLDAVMSETGIKPYMLQYQPLSVAGCSERWENCYDLQFDTLEEAKAARDARQGSRGNRYRVSVPQLRVEYVPVERGKA